MIVLCLLCLWYIVISVVIKIWIEFVIVIVRIKVGVLVDGGDNWIFNYLVVFMVIMVVGNIISRVVSVLGIDCVKRYIVKISIKIMIGNSVVILCWVDVMNECVIFIDFEMVICMFGFFVIMWFVLF